jgi:putative ABC transport system permease protein
LKTVLVIGEVSLTLALLLCAGDILYSFYSYMSVAPGFDPHNVLTMRMSLPKKKYANPQQWAAFFNRAVGEIGTIPTVTSAAAGSGAPMEDEGAIMRFHLAGNQPTRAINDGSMAEYFRISPDYFAVSGMRLLRGRALQPADREGFPRVAVINETLARKKFGNDDPIGKKIFLDGDVNESAAVETAAAPLEIVGVVHDTKQYGLFQITPQTIYASMTQDPEQAMSLLVKTSGDAGSVVAEIRSRLAKLDADQPVYNIRRLTEIFREEHAFFRFNTLLLALFATMALILSLTGIYAVMAYGVGQRAREFGIRLALGSPQSTILALVLRQGAWMCVIGITLGSALAWPATRMLARALKESMYLTLVPCGPILYPALCTCMGLTMMLACLLPARRATKADPMQALRCE